jgi:hypothetical protein
LRERLTFFREGRAEHFQDGRVETTVARGRVRAAGRDGEVLNRDHDAFARRSAAGVWIRDVTASPSACAADGGRTSTTDTAGASDSPSGVAMPAVGIAAL